MNIQQDAIYGNPVQAYQTLGATMVNPMQANGETDWGAILANGIRGAAQGAIAAQVNGAYASGQLMQPTAYQQPRSNGLTGLLLVGAVLYMVSQ
jgi:hypothetical protein